MDLARQIEDARAAVTRLERQAAAATCVQMGRHEWISIGGCNAMCDDFCNCSVPVHECARCRDCDYGDNDEARDVRNRCALSRSIVAEKREVKP